VSRSRSKAVIELGQQLVALLGADDDLLTSWMAHHISELMVKAETAKPSAQTAAREACANAILQLWRHKSALPKHVQSLDDMQAVLRTFAFLDLDPEDMRFQRTALRESVLANVQGAAKRPLEVAIGVDYTARLVIRMLLQQAAAAALGAAEPWVELARAAGAEDVTEQKLWVLLEDEEGAEVPGFNNAQAALQDRIGRLEAFAHIAAEEAARLRKLIARSDPAPPRPNRASKGRRATPSGRSSKGKARPDR